MECDTQAPLRRVTKEKHTMQKRILGTNGLEVSALGFGCMGISQSYGQPLSRAGRDRDHPRSGRRAA